MIGTDPDPGFEPTIRVEQLQEMEAGRFENFVADLWREQGYKTRIRGNNKNESDEGVDLVARKRGPLGEVLAVQAKRHGDCTIVGGPKTREYFAVKKQVGADRTLVVTSNEFSKNADKSADKLGNAIELINAEKLVMMIKRHASIQFYSKYREELGLSEDQIARMVESQKGETISQIIAAVLSIIAQFHIRLGKFLCGTGRVAHKVATTPSNLGRLQHSKLRSLGFEPVFEAEQIWENNGDESQGWIEENWLEHGKELITTGATAQPPPLLNWQPSARALVPETGVSPELRSRSSLTPRYHLFFPLLGSVFAGLALGAGLVEFTLRSQLVTLSIFIGTFLCAVGILASTVLYSQDFFDISRVVYFLPVFLLTGGILTGRLRPETELVDSTILLLLSAVPFSVQTATNWYRKELTDQYDPPEVENVYVPVYRSATVIGVLSVVILVAGSVLAIFDIVPTEQSIILGTVLQPGYNWILVSGFSLLLISCVFYIWDGGIIGTIATIIAIGTCVSMSDILNNGLFGSRVQLSVTALFIISILLGALLVFSQSIYRRIQSHQLLAGMIGLFLASELVGGLDFAGLLLSLPALEWQQFTISIIFVTAVFLLLVLYLEEWSIRSELGPP